MIDYERQASADVDLKKRLTQLKKEVPTRGLERYPEILPGINQLPEELQSTAVIELAERESVQTVIAFPSQIQRGWHYIPKQALLFTPKGIIHLIASVWPGQDPHLAVLDGSGLLYVQVTLILLYGFLDVVARGASASGRLGVEFNTVAWSCLEGPVRQFLKASTPDSAPKKPASSSSSQADREQLPLKFSNGLKIHGLLPGEELEEVVFQEAVWKRFMLLFRRPVIANTLILLTSHYVTVIKEELGVEQGWILTYIPRSNILGIQNRPCREWIEMTIQLGSGGDKAEIPIHLQESSTQAWRERWQKRDGSWTDLPPIELRKRK